MKKEEIILTRFDSKRLPGKALMKIAGEELLSRCINSIFPCKHFEVILATTDRTIDNPLIDLAEKIGIRYYRGDCDNVALRVKKCIEKYKIDIFARVNGDSFFIQKDLLIRGFEKIEKENYEFVTNLLPRAFPYGISIEILLSKTFISQFPNFISIEHKEHITSYFYENIKKINYFNIDYGFPNDHYIRFVIDTMEDKNRIEEIYKSLKNKEKPTLAELIKEYKKLYGNDQSLFN